MIRKVLSAVLIALTILGLVNVYADNAEVVAQAQQLVCGEKPCVRLLRNSRTPLGQDMTFQISVRPQRTRSVRCERAWIFLGEYSCRVTDGPAS